MPWMGMIIPGLNVTPCTAASQDPNSWSDLYQLQLRDLSRIWLHNRHSLAFPFWTSKIKSKHFPNITFWNNIIISQGYFLNLSFFLLLLHSSLFNTSGLSVFYCLPFSLVSLLCEDPVFCMWKWTVQSMCIPVSTPPMFRLLLETTIYLKMRTARTRVHLHHCCPNIPLCLWLCATVQRTLIIWCTSSSFWWASAPCCPGTSS